MNEMYLINGFDRASLGFGSDLPTGSDRAQGSPHCWSLHLCQMNQMWDEEPSELLMAKGYCTAVRANPLHVVDETFFFIPTYSANCRYLDRLTFGASVAQFKPAKKGGPAAVCRPPLR